MALIIIERLLHYKYVRNSESFMVTINAESGERIAQIQSGVTFKPKMGVIELVSASAEDKVVSAKTAITLVLKPQHAISRIDNPALVI